MDTKAKIYIAGHRGLTGGDKCTHRMRDERNEEMFDTDRAAGVGLPGK